MGRQLNLFTPLHQKTARDYLGRMNDEKVHCMEVARKFEGDFWDGPRRYGYGGYQYDGRWGVVAEGLIESYGLTSKAKVLDVGCGKGFLLYELTKLLPGLGVTGFDISKHALLKAKEEIRDNLFMHRAESPLPFADNAFDLTISLTTLHNLPLPELCQALKEIERTAKRKYILVESYRNPQELFNLQCWALTCESFFAPEEWLYVFQSCGYSGDYEFIFFE